MISFSERFHFTPSDMRALYLVEFDGYAARIDTLSEQSEQ